MSNSNFPWFPFYVRDWLTDTKIMMMSASARGAYIQLLALQWENGGLPNNWDKLAELTKYSPGLLMDDLEGCFVVGDDGLLRNERLMELRAEKVAKRAKQSAGARYTLAKREANRSVRASEKTDADADEEKSKTSVRKRPGGMAFPLIFESFWNFYPKRNEKRVGKKATYNRFKRLVDEDKQLSCVAADNYAQSKICRVDGKARDPERFLKDDYWRDWLDGPGTDEHVEERDKPRPADQAPPGDPPADPDDAAAELGHGSFLEAVRDVQRAMTLDEKAKPVEGGDAIEEA